MSNGRPGPWLSVDVRAARLALPTPCSGCAGASSGLSVVLSRWVRVPCFSGEGGQTGGALAGLLLPTSEPGDSHLCLGLLPQGKGWVMEPLPVAQPQGVADRVLGGVCVCIQSQKSTVCLWAAPARCDCVCRAQCEPGCGHPGEIHPLPQVMGRCCARGPLVWGSQMSCCRLQGGQCCGRGALGPLSAPRSVPLLSLRGPEGNLFPPGSWSVSICPLGWHLSPGRGGRDGDHVLFLSP